MKGEKYLAVQARLTRMISKILGNSAKEYYAIRKGLLHYLGLTRMVQ